MCHDFCSMRWFNTWQFDQEPLCQLLDLQVLIEVRTFFSAVSVRRTGVVKVAGCLVPAVVEYGFSLSHGLRPQTI